MYQSTMGQTMSCCPLPSSDSGAIREDDIAMQLPELKKLLQVLREKRESEGKCSSGGRCVPGDVFLVGTGPGDPELLTLKAVRVIKSADLLLYDRLVSNDVLDLVSPNAKLLYVGKTAGYHSRTQVRKRKKGTYFVVFCQVGFWLWVSIGISDWYYLLRPKFYVYMSISIPPPRIWICDLYFVGIELFWSLEADQMDFFFVWLVNVWQEEIHQLLLSFAEAGATVVRLKGGDPLVSFHLGLSNVLYIGEAV